MSWSLNLQVLLIRLLAYLILSLPLLALAYSKDYCTSLVNASTAALKSRNWLQLMETSAQYERNCPRFVTAENLASAIESQAIALFELGRLSEALAASRRCLQVFQSSACHLTKGRISEKLSKIGEATSEYKAASRIANAEIQRVTSELKHASPSSKTNLLDAELDNQLLEAELDKQRSIADFADTALSYLSPRASRAEVNPAPAEPKPPRYSTGSGLVVSSGGDVLTNNHVVAGCRRLTVIDASKQRGSANVVATDHAADLALVRIQTKVSTIAAFRSGKNLEVGEEVVVVGFPYAGLLASDANVSFGYIGALAGISDDRSKLQISAPVQPGNSGGPVLDQSGLIIGVVVQKLDALKMAKVAGDIPQNINFAIKGEVAQSFLRRSGVPIVVQSPDTTHANTEVARRGKNVTVLIACER